MPFCVPRVSWRMKERTTQWTIQKATSVASRSTEDIYVTHFAFNNGNIGAMVGIAWRIRTRHSHCVCISCLDIFPEFLFLLFSSFYIFSMLEHFLMSLLFSLQMSTSSASENWRKSFSQFKKENYCTKCCSSPQAMHGGVPDTGVSHLLRSNYNLKWKQNVIKKNEQTRKICKVIEKNV